MSNPCPCGSQQPLSHCCEPLHQGQPARSAEALMRSRYSAYALGRIDYLVATTLPVQQPGLDRTAMAQWSHESHWLGLEIEEHQPIAGQVEHAWVRFVARWQDLQGEQQHRERSAFVRPDGRWYFIDPTVPLERGRNDPCPCGGGLKFKKCCSTFVGT